MKGEVRGEGSRHGDPEEAEGTQKRGVCLLPW